MAENIASVKADSNAAAEAARKGHHHCRADPVRHAEHQKIRWEFSAGQGPGDGVKRSEEIGAIVEND